MQTHSCESGLRGGTVRLCAKKSWCSPSFSSPSCSAGALTASSSVRLLPRRILRSERVSSSSVVPSDYSPAATASSRGDREISFRSAPESSLSNGNDAAHSALH